VSPKQQAFVDAYLTVARGNGTKAAIAAGYSEKTAGVQASQILKHPEVRAALAKQLHKADLSTQARLEKLARLADHEPDTVTAGDVIKANQLILQVNGALQAKPQQSTGVTVNIGFLTAPGTQSIQPSIEVLTLESTTTSVKELTQQPQVVVSSGDLGVLGS
jgi:hypothetical protein